MSTKYLKSLIAVLLLAPLAGCATGGQLINTAEWPTSASGPAVE